MELDIDTLIKTLSEREEQKSLFDKVVDDWAEDHSKKGDFQEAMKAFAELAKESIRLGLEKIKKDKFRLTDTTEHLCNNWSQSEIQMQIKSWETYNNFIDSFNRAFGFERGQELTHPELGDIGCSLKSL